MHCVHTDFTHFLATLSDGARTVYGKFWHTQRFKLPLQEKVERRDVWWSRGSFYRSTSIDTLPAILAFRLSSVWKTLQGGTPSWWNPRRRDVSPKRGSKTSFKITTYISPFTLPSSVMLFQEYRARLLRLDYTGPGYLSSPFGFRSTCNYSQ